MNILGEVIQGGAFSINAQRSILITKVLFQQSFGRAQQPERQLCLRKSDKLKLKITKFLSGVNTFKQRFQTGRTVA